MRIDADVLFISFAIIEFGTPFSTAKCTNSRLANTASSFFDADAMSANDTSVTALTASAISCNSFIIFLLF